MPYKKTYRTNSLSLKVKKTNWKGKTRNRKGTVTLATGTRGESVKVTQTPYKTRSGQRRVLERITIIKRHK